MQGPSVVIVSPAKAAANNGNGQTAERWRHWLSGCGPVRTTRVWPDEQAGADAVMLALHARHCAPAIAAWAQQRGSARLAVVLTGTDLYRDIATDTQALSSLERAGHLVVLQARGLEALPEGLRGKARVIYQSTPTRATLPKTTQELRTVMVGHLRAVKSPDTLFAAARLLAAHVQLRIDHIGDALEPGWAEQARATEAANPRYRWLGARSPAQARQAIQRAHVLVHTSAIEGGAHVIMEAVCSGTPVLASRVDGNVGMLGDDYGGYFPHGDAAALAQLLLQCRAGQRDTDPTHGLLARLRAQCTQRAPLFAPALERAAVRRLVADLDNPPDPNP